MTLRILGLDGCLATIIEQELSKVKVALLTSSQIETSHCHLCYLMTRHHAHLTGIRSYFLTGHIGIATGNIEELAFARSLPIGHCALNHMSQVIKLVRKIFLLDPTTITGPVVRVGRVLRTGRIKVAIGLLSCRNDIDNGVAVGFQLLIRIGLQDIGSTL